MKIDELRQLYGVKPARKRPRHEEHSLQAACVRWFRLRHPKMRHNLFAVPNGGWRTEGEAARLKDEGVLAGVSDLILLKGNRFYGALLIEMKTATGRQSAAQREWQGCITTDGYKYVVCRSLDEFAEEVEAYLADA